MAIYLPSPSAISPTIPPPLLDVPLPRSSLKSLSPSSSPFFFMGGGPRTYPGGVTKWQWKRMQLKKTRQIEKARLLREKHVYESRRRAELLAASPVLEMPWQKMSRVRPPNYVSPDEQITKLAARFQKEGAEDLWTEKDGPEKFEILEQHSISSSDPEWLNEKSQGIGTSNSWTVSDNLNRGSRPSFRSFRKMGQPMPNSKPFIESQWEAHNN